MLLVDDDDVSSAVEGGDDDDGDDDSTPATGWSFSIAVLLCLLEMVFFDTILRLLGIRPTKSRDGRIKVDPISTYSTVSN